MTKNIRDQHPSGVCPICRTWVDRLSLDHIVPFFKGGEHSISNIQWICLSCHRGKSNSEIRGIPNNKRVSTRSSQRYAPSGVCQTCNHWFEKLQFDHILARVEFESDEAWHTIENTQWLCRECHIKKTADLSRQRMAGKPGRQQSLEERQKRIETRKTTQAAKTPEERSLTGRRISKALTGKTSPRKGMTWDDFYGPDRAQEIKKNRPPSNSLKGVTPSAESIAKRSATSTKNGQSGIFHEKRSTAGVLMWAKRKGFETVEEYLEWRLKNKGY